MFNACVLFVGILAGILVCFVSVNLCGNFLGDDVANLVSILQSMLPNRSLNWRRMLLRRSNSGSGLPPPVLVGTGPTLPSLVRQGDDIWAFTSTR